MVKTTQPTIQRASAIVEEEIEFVSAERDAFERFLSRLHDVQVPDARTGGPAQRGGATATLFARAAGPSDELAAVRTAYRETVMDVPHFDTEYGETLQENLAAEAGEPLATQVATGEELTPAVYEALVEASESSRDDREDFLGHLERERDSLAEVETELNDLEARVVELQEALAEATTSTEFAAIDDELQTIEQRCTDLANRRQRLLHNRATRTLSGIDDVSLAGYLYSELDTVTPALTDIASCLELVRHCRKRCLR